eukprot:g3075.t1
MGGTTSIPETGDHFDPAAFAEICAAMQAMGNGDLLQDPAVMQRILEDMMDTTPESFVRKSMTTGLHMDGRVFHLIEAVERHVDVGYVEAGGAPCRALDLGSGPGTMPVLMQTWWRNRVEFRCVDSSTMIEGCMEWLLQRATWRLAVLGSYGPPKGDHKEKTGTGDDGSPIRDGDLVKVVAPGLAHDGKKAVVRASETVPATSLRAFGEEKKYTAAEYRKRILEGSLRTPGIAAAEELQNLANDLLVLGEKGKASRAGEMATTGASSLGVSFDSRGFAAALLRSIRDPSDRSIVVEILDDPIPKKKKKDRKPAGCVDPGRQPNNKSRYVSVSAESLHLLERGDPEPHTAELMRYYRRKAQHNAKKSGKKYKKMKNIGDVELREAMELHEYAAALKCNFSGIFDLHEVGRAVCFAGGQGSCMLVTAICLLMQVGCMDPFLWEDVLQIADKVLLPGGVLLQYDTEKWGGFADRTRMEGYVKKKGLALEFVERSEPVDYRDDPDGRMFTLVWKKLGDENVSAEGQKQVKQHNAANAGGA